MGIDDDYEIINIKKKFGNEDPFEEQDAFWSIDTLIKEGEIPYYRGYGMNLKQFLHKPLGPMLAREIKEYVDGKIEAYEQRVEVYKVNAASDYVNQSVILQYYVRIKTTGEIVGLEPLVVPIG